MDVESPASVISVTAPVCKIRVPSLIRCGFMLLTIRIALKTGGFARTVRWIGRQVAPIPVASSFDLEAVRTVEHMVAVAGALYPGRARCLEQSLVLYYLLRQQGVAVNYCQGVEPHPFEGHAWIEYRSEPINDVREHVKQFSRLPDLLP